MQAGEEAEPGKRRDSWDKIKVMAGIKIVNVTQVSSLTLEE